MLSRCCFLPTACAVLALIGCNTAPAPATLDAIDWSAIMPVSPMHPSALDAAATADAIDNARARKALRARSSPTFDNAGFAAVLDYIEATTGVDVHVNWQALAFSDITPTTPVTMDLTQVRAERILQIAIEQASVNAFEHDKAGYEIVDGLVNITILSEISARTEVRIYDIRELLVGPTLYETLYADRPDAEAIAQVLRTEGFWVYQDAPEFDLNLALG